MARKDMTTLHGGASSGGASSGSVNYDIDYNDKRFVEVKADEKAALSEVDKTYGGMISDSEKYYQAQIDASKEWAETQKKNQQEQTDFAIEKIEQQKGQAHTDYIKEQSGAYKDWQKQSNPYGANAEQMAAQGMQNTGYSESAQVSMYNTYQNRVATAREGYMRAVLNYDNAIKDARLQNNSVLAEIAYNALQKQLELSLQGFQYKNQLVLEKANKKTELGQIYHQRYQDVLNQINKENALAEEVRQYNDTMAFNRQKEANDKAYRDAQLALQREQFAWQKAQAAKSSSGGGPSSIKKSSGSSSSKKGAKASGKDSSSIRASKSSSVGNSGNTKSSGRGKTPTVDMKSVLNLGFGPISAARLDQLVGSGTVEEYEKNGKLKYRKVIPGHRGGR